MAPLATSGCPLHAVRAGSRSISWARRACTPASRSSSCGVVVNADAGSRVLSRGGSLGLGARSRPPVQAASQWRFCCPSPTSRVTPPVGTGPAACCAPSSRDAASCHPLAFVDVPRNQRSSSADVGGGVPAVSSRPRRSALPARHPIDPAPHDLPGDLCVRHCHDDHPLWVPRAVGPPPRARLDVHPSALCLIERRPGPRITCMSVSFSVSVSVFLVSVSVFLVSVSVVLVCSRSSRSPRSSRSSRSRSPLGLSGPFGHKA
jgi:hypothetical protein